MHRDPNNCGICGNSCGANGICDFGRCKCPDNYIQCNGNCCHPSQACVNGVCSSCSYGQACGDRCCPDASTCAGIGDGRGSCRCLEGYSPCGTHPNGTGFAVCCHDATSVCAPTGICLAFPQP